MLSSFSRVMLDVETRVLNQQRERNPEKFPEYFAFHEVKDFESQNVIQKSLMLGRRGENPWGYTLEGCRVHDKLQ